MQIDRTVEPNTSDCVVCGRGGIVRVRGCGFESRVLALIQNKSYELWLVLGPLVYIRNILFLDFK